jgi:hypothetical protein
MGMDVVVGIFVVIVGDAVVSSTVFPSDCLVTVIIIGDSVVVLAIISVVCSTAGLGVVSPSNSLG